MAKAVQFLTVKEAAALLGVSPNTIRNWDSDGKIPVYRHPMNGYRLFKRSDLQAVVRMIEASGTYPAGWAKRGGNRNRKPK